MDNTIVFSEFRQGASHKPDKPCQDHARHLTTDKIDIITLSDGHGGKKYFRSHYGAEIATDIAQKTLRIFCSEVDFNQLLGDENFIQVPIEQEADSNHSELEYVMRHMFQHICSEWHRRIEEHFKNNPLTREEEDFLRKETDKGNPLFDYYFDASGKYIKTSLPSAYGCTLFGVAETKSGYWIGFQIGDGKCVAFSADGTWYEPIPWDNRCFQNVTTSLSHYDEESFRYCIGRTAPDAIFIASDGMDDSYAPMSELAFEYVLIFLANLAINGEKATAAKIGEWLDTISSNYSRDDMSVGYIVHPEQLQNLIMNFLTLEERKLIDKKDILKEEANNKKRIYENALGEISSISQNLTELILKTSELSNQGECKQLEYDENLKEINSRKNSRKNFLARFKRSTSLSQKYESAILCEKEEANRKIDEEISSIVQKVEENDLEISKLKDLLDSLNNNLPILKKHANEATKNFEIVANKLRRIDRIRQYIQNK